MLKLLTTIPVFLRSRQKLLIKRRKIRLRNRPMSKKQLKQERKVMNISYQTKLVEIKKQMNRRKSQNHHLNEIIQDLFYPQLEFQNLEQVDLRAKQISNDPNLREDQWEQMLKMDDLQQQIRQNSLPMQLLQLHEQKSSFFNHSHYKILLDRLNYYCYNRDRIQKQRLQNWQKILQKMKVKDQKVKQQAKCPYLFLQRDQIPRHEFWFNLVQQIKLKMQNQKSIQGFNQYLDVLMIIQRTFQHIPSELYQLAMNRNSIHPFEELRPQNVSQLLYLLKCRNKIRFNANIRIPTHQQEVNKEYNHVLFARKLVSEVIQKPQQYKISDLTNIFKIISNRKKRMTVLNQNQFPHIEKIVQKFLNQLSFVDVQMFFCIYCSLNQNPNLQFIQILKFDLFRKAESCQSYYFMLDLINRVKERQFLFRVYISKGLQPQILKIKALQIFLKLSQVITKHLDKMKSHELIRLLDAYYQNQLKDLSLIEILSTQIVKRASQQSLQTLGKSLYKLTLLGHRSKLLAKYIFQQFYQRYHNQLKKYKEQGLFLFPTQQKIESLPLDMKQLYLQECLLMTLWSVCKQLGSELQNTIDLQQMLQIIPIKIDSLDPLCIQLALNLNLIFKEYSLFPKINYSQVQAQSFPAGRFNEFYGKTYSKSQIQKLMQEQAIKSGLFTQNYNKKDSMFLKQQWSNAFVYDERDYLNFCIRKAGNGQIVINASCFFDKQVILDEQFVKRRSQLLAKVFEEKQTQIKTAGKTTKIPKTQKKLYELLF